MSAFFIIKYPYGGGVIEYGEFICMFIDMINKEKKMAVNGKFKVDIA